MRLLFIILIFPALGLAESPVGWDEETIRQVSDVSQRGRAMQAYFAVLRRSAASDLTGFIRETAPLYRRLNPTWAEVTKVALDMRGGLMMNRGPTANQLAFYEAHLGASAPAHLRPIFELLEKVPADFPAEARAKIWRDTLPRLLRAPSWDWVCRALFFEVHDSFFKVAPVPEQLEIYRAQNPTFAELVQTAHAVALPESLQKQYREPEQGGFVHEPLRAATFLLEELKRTTSLEEAGRLHLQITRELHMARQLEYHRPESREPRESLHVAFRGAGEDLVQRLANHHGDNDAGFVAAVTKLHTAMFGADPHRNTNYILEGALRSARTLRRFRDLRTRMRAFSGDSKELLQVEADRFAEVIAWNPPTDFVRELYGGKRVSEAQLRELAHPTYFLALFDEATAQDRWKDRRELELFLTNELPKFAEAPDVRKAMWRVAFRELDKETLARHPDARAVAEMLHDAGVPPVEKARLVAKLGLREFPPLSFFHGGYSIDDTRALIALTPVDAAGRELARLGQVLDAIAAHAKAQGALPDDAFFAAAARRFAPTESLAEFTSRAIRLMHDRKLIDAAAAVPTLSRLANVDTTFLRKLLSESPKLSAADGARALAILHGEDGLLLKPDRPYLLALLQNESRDGLLSSLTEDQWPADVSRLMKAAFPEGVTEGARLAMALRELAREKKVPEGFGWTASLFKRIGDAGPDGDAAQILREALEQSRALYESARLNERVLPKISGSQSRSILEGTKCRAGFWARLWGGAR